MLTLEYFIKGLPDLDDRLMDFLELVEMTFYAPISSSSRLTKETLLAAMTENFALYNEVIRHLRTAFPEVICLKKTEL